MRKQRVRVADIFVDTRNRRGVDRDVVNSIAASIQKIGLQNPISICFRDDVKIDGEMFDSVAVLVAGAHRREALMLLGSDYEYVDAVVFDDENTARLWEISENLHRKDLTPLERDEQVAEWIERTERVMADSNAFQIETHKKKGQQPGGVNAAARELGISKPDAHRAVKVASLPEEVKELARETGLDRNRSALLKAAKAETPEAAVATIREIAEAKASPKPKPVSALAAMGLMAKDYQGATPIQEPDQSALDAEEQRFWKYWASLSPAAHRRILPKLKALSA